MKFTKIALAALALAAAPAAATSIVDTGAPSGPGYGWSLDYGQFLAAKFTAPAATLTDLTGYIGTLDPGSFHVVLYTAPGGTPGTELFSAATTSTATRDFQGVHGVNWAVAAGDYFIAFEVRPGDTFDGYMPNPSPTPLGTNAVRIFSGWLQYDVLQLGIRVDGTLGAVGGVPEPASWALMIAGFGLVGVSARRRRTLTA